MTRCRPVAPRSTGSAVATDPSSVIPLTSRRARRPQLSRSTRCDTHPTLGNTAGQQGLFRIPPRPVGLVNYRRVPGRPQNFSDDARLGLRKSIPRERGRHPTGRPVIVQGGPKWAAAGLKQSRRKLHASSSTPPHILTSRVCSANSRGHRTGTILTMIAGSTRTSGATPDGEATPLSRYSNPHLRARRHAVRVRLWRQIPFLHSVHPLTASAG